MVRRCGACIKLLSLSHSAGDVDPRTGKTYNERNSFLPQRAFHNVYGLYDIVSGHRLTEEIEIHFLEMPKVPTGLKRDLRGMRLLEKWMAFLNNKLTDAEMEALAMSEAAIDQAWDATTAFMRDKMMRIAYLEQEIAEHDYTSAMDFAKEQGMEMGIAQGIEQGIEQGLAQGLAQARAEADLKIKNIALRLLRAGTSAADAAAAVELPESSIRRLAEENGIPCS